MSHHLSVARDSPLWGGYQPGGVYETLRDVFLMKHDVSGQYLIPEKNYQRGLGRHHLAPVSITEYKKDPESASLYKLKNRTIKLNVIGIVSRGTKIKVTDVTVTQSWMAGFGRSKRVIVYAEIMSGAYAGTVADIRDLSVYYKPEGIEYFIYKPEKGVILSTNHPVR